jgi:hypothetical protein
MKCNTKVYACTLCILLSAFVLPLVIVAEAGLPHQGAPGALSSDPREGTSEETPTVVDDIWGPQVGPPGTGKSIPLAPLQISDDQIAANSTIVSDDFNGCALNTSVWTFIDPHGDCTYDIVGSFTEDAWLSITAPSGSDHDLWTQGNFAPRVMQAVSDTDFEVEVKFESGLSQQYQMQGILVEQASDHFLRLEFHSDGSDTKLYAASLEPDPSPPSTLTYSVYYSQPITDPGVAPLYMRVRREGDQWTLYYSDDGVDWTTAITFAHALAVTKLGTYAANAGSSPPTHTAYIDYFFNTASPVYPEDGERNTLTVDIVGNGLVDIDPVKSNYDCGDEVTLTATPDPGGSFAVWSGDLKGEDNPTTIIMDGSKDVVANFGHRTFMPLVSKAPFTNYLFVGDFETGDLTGFYWLHNQPEVVSINTPIQLGPGPPHDVRAGTYSMRSYLDRYDSEFSYKTMVHVGSDDQNVPNYQSAFRFDIGSEYWIGMSIYLPSDWVDDVEGCGDLIWQFQASPDEGEDYRTPILPFFIQEDRYDIWSRWDTRAFSPDKAWTGNSLLWSGPLAPDKGRWVDWVMNVRWSWEDDGYIKIWKDGAVVAERNGPNCANDQVGPYTSFGIYKWPWNPDGEGTYPESLTDYRLAYYDELRIAGVDGSYGAVVAGPPS